jgi:type IV secretory pathway TraG/TraD family ATPase VirD4
MEESKMKALLIKILKEHGVKIAIAMGILMLFGIKAAHIPFSSPIVKMALVTVGVSVFVAFIFQDNSQEITTHGSARWAKNNDIKTMLVPIDQPPALGAFTLGPAPEGKKNGQPKYRIDINNTQRLRSIAILGMSGTGKGQSYFKFNLIYFNGSYVYYDLKDEGWNECSGYRENSVRLAPGDPDNSWGMNWIPLCEKDSNISLLLAQAVVEGFYDGAGEPFYKETEAILLAGLFHHATTFPHPTPAAVYDFYICRSGDEVLHELLHSPNDLARNRARMFLNAPETTRANILVGTGLTLDFLNNESARRFTSILNPPDYSILKRQQISLYWCVNPAGVKLFRPLTLVFITLCLYQLRNSRGNVPVSVMLDELGNIGRIPGIEEAINYDRGLGIGYVFGLQYPKQLAPKYGIAADQIYDCCQTKVILPGMEVETAEKVSRALGKTTVQVKSNSQSNTGSGFFSGNKSQTEANTSRSLLFADEVRTIGDDEQIIIALNKLPIRTDRFWYSYKGKRAKARSCNQILTMKFTDDGAIPVTINFSQKTQNSVTSAGSGEGQSNKPNLPKNVQGMDDEENEN